MLKARNCEATKIDYDAFAERGKNAVLDAFTDIKKNFSQKIFTVMDLHAVPEELPNRKGNTSSSLQEWIEQEVMPLQESEDFQKFTRLMQMAHRSLSTEGRARFLTEKKINQRELRPNASRVVSNIKSEFNNIESIKRFFTYVRLDLDKNLNDFLVDRQVGKFGHERFSACRILKRAFVLSVIEKYLLEVGQWARFIFQVGECPDSRNVREGQKETGLFYTSVPATRFFTEEEQRQGEFHGWRMIDETLASPSLLIDNEGMQRGIKFIEMSFKDANEAIRKLERKGKVSPEEINELFRFRVVLERKKGESDDELRHRKLAFLSKIDDVAQMKMNIPIEVQTRTIGGLQTVGNSPEENYRIQKAYVDTFEFFDFRLKPEKNALNNDEYKNFSQKIKYRDPETDEMLFGFEVQVVDTEEYISNENPKTRAAHFPRKIEAMGGLELPRMNSVMTRAEYVEHLESWLRDYEKRHPKKESIAWRLLKMPWAKDQTKGGFPTVLEGDHVYYPGWKSNPSYGKWRANKKHFKIDFAPGEEEIDLKEFKEMAEAAFEFLFASGAIRKVSQNFPQKINASAAELERSKYFLGTEAYCTIVENLVAPASKKK